MLMVPPHGHGDPVAAAPRPQRRLGSRLRRPTGALAPGGAATWEDEQLLTWLHEASYTAAGVCVCADGFVDNFRMASTTVRISDRDHRRLRALAAAEGLPLQTILERAIDLYRRQRFFRELDEGYATIWADPEAAAEEADGRALWDQTLADGLEEL